MTYLCFFAFLTATPPEKFCFFTLLTVIFAVLGRVVRGVTTDGALAGAAICFGLLWGGGIGGFFLLLTVFVLTWVSTRLRSEEHTSELQSLTNLVCRLLLEKKNKTN